MVKCICKRHDHSQDPVLTTQPVYYQKKEEAISSDKPPDAFLHLYMKNASAKPVFVSHNNKTKGKCKYCNPLRRPFHLQVFSGPPLVQHGPPTPGQYGGVYGDAFHPPSQARQEQERALKDRQERSPYRYYSKSYDGMSGQQMGPDQYQMTRQPMASRDKMARERALWMAALCCCCCADWDFIGELCLMQVYCCLLLTDCVCSCDCIDWSECDVECCDCADCECDLDELCNCDDFCDCLQNLDFDEM